MTDAAETPRFDVVPALPSGLDGVEAGLAAWVEAPALAAVVAAFDGVVPAGPLGDRLAWLDEFSLRWDFRGGRERNLTVGAEFSPAVAALIDAAAEALGLKGAVRAPAARYEHVLILGGLVRACLARPMHAAELLADGGLSAGALTALGGYRPLAGNELPLAASMGLDGLADEFDAMDAGVRGAFGVVEPVAERGHASKVVGESWRVREYRPAAGVRTSVIAAPSTEPGTRRANTPDTYAWFASEVAHLQPGDRVLVVTTAIYVPFQHANALRMLALPYGVEVDTVGQQPGAFDVRLAQEFLPHHYLQELRSTIRALRDLHGALSDPR